VSFRAYWKVAAYDAQGTLVATYPMFWASYAFARDLYDDRIKEARKKNLVLYLMRLPSEDPPPCPKS
jgi:hypothetical protein